METDIDGTLPPRTRRSVGYAFLVFGAILAPLVAGMTIDAVARRDWPVVEGAVVALAPAPSPSEAIVSYRYTASDGRPYEQREKRRKIAELTPGRPVLVRYDPGDPTVSTTRPSFAEYVSVVVGTAGVVFLWGFAAWGLAGRRERAPAS